MELKKQLNQVKSELDWFPLDAWHNHTRRMNVGQLITQYVKQYFNPEFSSQAWGKMFEMLCEFCLIPSHILNQLVDANTEIVEGSEAVKKVYFDSVHLCEAPGAFISALNHFIQISFQNMEVRRGYFIYLEAI